MSHQIEIMFSYGEKQSKTRTMRRDVNWAERLDDLFAGMQSDGRLDSTLKAAEKRGSVQADTADDKASI